MKAQKGRLIGVLLLCSSLIAGSWANQIAAESASRDWLKRTSPKERVWSYVLGSYGLRKAPGRSEHEQKALRTATRSLPIRVDGSGEAWISSAPVWIALQLSSDTPSGPSFYCLDCDRAPLTPQAWQTLGEGWPGLEQAAGKLEQIRLNSQLSRARLPKGDPREIVY